MKHDLILCILTLPLITGLAICTSVIVAQPLYRVIGASESSQTPGQDAAVADNQGEVAPPVVAEPTQSESTETAVTTITGQDEPPAFSTDEESPFLALNEAQSDQPDTVAGVVATDNDPGRDPERESFPWESEPTTPAGLKSPPLTHQLAEVAKRLGDWSRTVGRDVADDSPAVPSGREDRRVDSIDEAHDELAEGLVEPSDSTAIQITNPSDHEYAVSFLLNKQVATLQPGQTLTHPAAPATIHFDRGGTLGDVQRELVSGRYQFVVSEAGWALETTH